jgi:hypothetical protein
MKGYRRLTQGAALSCAAIALTPAVASAAPPDTRSCPQGTRAVHGPAGVGCTTSSLNDFDEVAALAVILTGAGGFAIVRETRGRSARRRGRRSIRTAISGQA